MAQDFNRGGVAATGKALKSVVVPIATKNGAYTAGDCVGGKLTLAGALRIPGNPAELRSVFLFDKGNQKAALTLLLFNADPAASTLTDNTAPTLDAADVGKVIAKIDVATSVYATIDSKAWGSVACGDLIVSAAAGTALYAAILCTATPNYASVSGLTLVFNFVQS